MGIHDKEHYDLMAQFEKDAKLFPRSIQLRKEPKELWTKGCIYQHGETNIAFLLYRAGYAFGKVVGRDDQVPL